jgi:hypothetical protein
VEDKEPFLSRWSRRKLETKEDAPAGVANAPETRTVAPAVPLAPAAEPPLPEPAAPDTPEYRELFDPQVDETLRRTALKKLFSDPHFNVMDGLDTYIDDYSKPDPIPEVVLRQLNQAKDLFLFDSEEQPGANASDEVSVAAGEAEIPRSVAAAGAATPSESSPPPAKTDATR